MNINIPNIFTKVVTAALLGSAAIVAASFFITALSPVSAIYGYDHHFQDPTCLVIAGGTAVVTSLVASFA
jgi:hypothetical protein